jgi:hypothetical protein
MDSVGNGERGYFRHAHSTLDYCVGDAPIKSSISVRNKDATNETRPGAKRRRLQWNHYAHSPTHAPQPCGDIMPKAVDYSTPLRHRDWA